MSNTFAAGQEAYEDMNSKAGFEPRFPILKVDVGIVFPTIKNPLAGRILPAFDTTLIQQDEAFATSYAPYRIKGAVDKETGFEKFSGWFVPVPGYNFFGSGRNTFFSPHIYKGIDASKACDPIFECRMLVYRKNKQGDSSYMNLVTRPKNYTTDIHVLPNISTLCLMNVLCPPSNSKDDDQSIKNRVMVCKPATIQQALKDLNEERPAWLAEPVDKDWPEFLYGDVTHPEHGLYFNVVEGTMDTSNFSFARLNFGDKDRPNKQVQIHRYPVDETILQGRIVLNSFDTIYVPSTQELVNLLAEERLVPYDLLAEAMEGKAILPEAYTAKPAIYVQTNDAKPGDAAAYTPTIAGDAAAAASMPAAPVPPAAPAPPAAPSQEQSYWVVENGASILKTRSQVQQMVNSGYAGPCMLAPSDAEGWKTADAYGITAPAAAPAPPTQPAAPVPPAAPAPPAAPQEEAATQPAPVTEAPMPVQAFQTPPAAKTASASSLTPEEQAEFNDLQSRLNPQEGQAPLSLDDLQRFKALLLKSNK